MFYPTKMVAEPRRLGAAPKWKKACPLSFNFECGTTMMMELHTAGIKKQ